MAVGDPTTGGMTGFATEATLQKLLLNSKEQIRLIGLTATALKVNSAEVQQSFDRAAVAGTAAADNIGSLGTAANDASSSIAAGGKAVKDTLSGSSNIFSTVLNTAGHGISQMIASMPAGPAKNFAVTVEAAAGAAGGLFTGVMRLNRGINDLYNTGVVFDRGMQGMVDSASRVGVTSDQLANIMARHAGVVSTMGVKAFVDLGEATRKNTAAFAEMGIVGPEAMTDAVSRYAELLRSTGRLQHQSTEDLVNGSIQYEQELSQLSQATGRRRDDLEKEHKEFMARAATQLAAAGLSDAQRKNFDAGMLQTTAQFGPMAEQMKTMVAQMIRGGGDMHLFSQEQQDLINRTGNFAALQALTNAMLKGDQEGMHRATAAMQKNFEQSAVDYRTATGSLGQSAELAQAFSTSIKTAGSAATEGGKAQDTATKNINTAASAAQEFGAQATNLVDAATASAGALAANTDLFLESVKKLTDWTDHLQLVARAATGETGMDLDKVKSAARDVASAAAAGGVLAGSFTELGKQALQSFTGAGEAPGETGKAAGAAEEGRAGEPGGREGAPRPGLGGAGRVVAGYTGHELANWLRDNGHPQLAEALDAASIYTGASGAAKMVGARPGTAGAVGATAAGANALWDWWNSPKTPAEGAAGTAAPGVTPDGQTTTAMPGSAPSSQMEMEIVKQLQTLNRETMLVLGAIEAQTRAITATINRNGTTVN